MGSNHCYYSYTSGNDDPGCGIPVNTETGPLVYACATIQGCSEQIRVLADLMPHRWATSTIRNQDEAETAEDVDLWKRTEEHREKFKEMVDGHRRLTATVPDSE